MEHPAGHPLDGVIGAAWARYRRHWPRLMVVALVVHAVVALLSLGVSFLPGYLALVGGLAVAILGVLWLQGVLVTAVEDLRTHRPERSVQQTVAAVRPHLGTVVVVAGLAAVGLALGFALLFIPGLVLLTFWSVVIPAAVLEQRGTVASFRRSQNLVRGHGLHVFALLAFSVLLLIAVDLVVEMVFGALGVATQAFLGTLLSGTIVGPFAALVWTLVYVELRADGGDTAGVTTDPDLARPHPSLTRGA